MNLNNVNLIKLGNDSEVSLMKYNGAIVYQKIQQIFPEGHYQPREYRNNTTITEVNTIVSNKHTSLDLMFETCNSLMTVNTTEWDTSNVTNMEFMFSRCVSLESLDLSKFNTSKVTDMGCMFQGCSSLVSLDLSNFDTNKVTDMNNMFFDCEKLESLDLSNWDMTNVSNEYYPDENGYYPEEGNFYMFENCNELHTLRLDNCSTDTINKITTSIGFPTGKTTSGKDRTIYCKEENFVGVVYPGGWKPKFI